MTWTKELPTKPGLYAWCDGKGVVKLMDVLEWGRGGCLANTLGVADSKDCDDIGGFWQPIHIKLPAPYVPPKPPKVEVYSAKCAGGDQRWMIVINNRVRVIDNSGDDTNGDACSWDEIRPYYTDIQRVPDETSA